MQEARGPRNLQITRNACIKDILGEEAKYLECNNNTITFFRKDNKVQFQAVNRLEESINLTQEEFLACSNLERDNINIAQIVDYFIVSGKSPWNNIVFVYIPKDAYDTEEYSKLINFLDGAIIIPSISTLLKKDQLHLKCHYNVYQGYNKRKELQVWLEKNNQRSNNFYDFFNLQKLLLTMVSEISIQGVREEKLKQELQKDRVKGDLLDEGNKDYKELAIRIQNRSQQITSDIEALIDLLDKLKSILQKAEAEFISKDFVWDKLHYQSIICCLDYGMLLIKNNFKKEYDELYGFLKGVAEDYTYLLDMYVTRNFTTSNLEKLKKEPITNGLIFYLKLINEIKTGEDLYQENILINSKKHKGLFTGQECLILGERYKNTVLEKIFYLQGAEKGNLECGKRLLAILNYTNAEDITWLEALAHTLNYYGAKAYADYLAKQRKNNLSRVWMHIAASQGSVDALAFLAERCYINRDKDEQTRKIGLNLFSELIKKGYSKDKCYLRIGEIYITDKKYTLAYNKLCESKEPMAYYWRGMLKANLNNEYKNFVRDLEEAARLLKKALDLNVTAASYSLIQVNRELLEKQKPQPKPVYMPKPPTRKESPCKKDCCFVMAATCVSLSMLSGTVSAQKVNDVLNNKIVARTLNAESLGTCRTLLLYHNYRDNSLLKQDNGQKLLDEYYRISTLLIEKINENENAQDIYKDIYYDKIVQAMQNIKRRDYQQADHDTIKMMVDLCHKYDITIDESINNYLNNSRRI